MKHKGLTAVALAVTVGGVGIGSAVATPGSGILSALILARGTLDVDSQHMDGHDMDRDDMDRHGEDRRDMDRHDMDGDDMDGHHESKRQKSVKIRLHKPSDVAVQQVIIGPGGSTGWHSHPGPAVVIVKSGSFTLYDGDDPICTPTTYAAGKVFIDEGRGHVHIGRNTGSTDTELYVTYLDVPVGAAPRIDVPDPGNCTF